MYELNNDNVALRSDTKLIITSYVAVYLIIFTSVNVNMLYLRALDIDTASRCDANLSNITFVY